MSDLDESNLFQRLVKDSCKKTKCELCSWLVAFVKEVTTIEGLLENKKVYDAEDIQKFLGIGRSKTYTFLEEVYQKQEPFRVLKVGKLFRVPKQSFDNWLNGIS